MAIEDDVQEITGSRAESETWNGAFTASRKVLTPWSTRASAMTAILTWPGQVYPGRAGVYAKSVSCRPVPAEEQGSGAWASYEYAELTINYKSPTPFDPLADDSGPSTIVFSESIEPTSEFMRLSSTGLTWFSDDVALTAGEAPGRLECGFNYVFTRYQWAPSSGQVADILSLVGTVNGADVTSIVLGATFPSETLLFIDPSFQREWNSAGNNTLTGVFRMAYRAKINPSEGGWNQVWRPNKAGGAGYDKIKDETGSQLLLYPHGDFTKIKV